MGKFINTTYHDTVEQVSGFYESLVNNPFYKLNDKKPTIVTYYNINTDFTSLDPGSKLHMDNMGPESPIRYNKIEDFIMYGFQRIELQTENGEFGLEADDVEGECFILPNTIIPTPGDYFEVEHITDSTWLFIVKDVQKDTLDNGSNVYKISYKIEYINHDEILKKIVYNFRMIDSIEGTNISKIVRCEDYDIAKIMDEKAVMLKKYFNELFYSRKVQTYIYQDLSEINIYDPFMIEFLIRNKILENGEDSYIFVTHQIPTLSTFTLEYDKTFFRKFEENNKDELLSSCWQMSIEEIKSYGTTFSSRFESYFKTTGMKKPGYNVSMLDEDIIYRILENNLQEDIKEQGKKSLLWQNIIINYFNNGICTEEEIESIDDLCFEYSKDAFYTIPILIFCLEKGIENALK